MRSPRKPSEKKRRMTKNKLAKLAKAQSTNDASSAVQQSLPQDFDPAALLDDSLASHAVSGLMPLTTFGTVYAPPQPMVHAPNDMMVTFDSGPDFEGKLLASLQEFNAGLAGAAQAAATNHPTALHFPSSVSSTHFHPSHAGSHLAPAPVAVTIQKLVNGRDDEVETFPFVMSPQTQAIIEQPWLNDFHEYPAIENTAGPTPQPFTGVNDAEVTRQTELDRVFDTFIDMGFTGSPSVQVAGAPEPITIDDALKYVNSETIDEINYGNVNLRQAMPHLADNYELDFSAFVSDD
ncbi:hypothetical protein LTR53_006272 [Teratosphaeriaceae sp. CCFEE 6253]|nr:hypothetical protein LTR53_006272 [Teratosphaeriaceae sp. CCFEE 6253]